MCMQPFDFPIASLTIAHASLDRYLIKQRVYTAVKVCCAVLPSSTLLGQLLSNYGHWGYGAHGNWSKEHGRARASWFPLTVLVAAGALYGWYGVTLLYRAMQVGVGQFSSVSWSRAHILFDIIHRH